MKQTLTDKLVYSFTWNGGENSLKFGDTTVANAFYLSAKKCSNFDGPANKEIFKSHMLEVLRHTKQRYKKYLKKHLPDYSPEDEAELKQKIAELESQQMIISNEKDDLSGDLADDSANDSS
ncbi:uncharacterized protein LOC122504081 [Leptopilina heterotoma]|uniref:uncharacterized protein LOC122504081 n=1 Tax=Leptopilina heterotoma TaxID=63436 RepID=UPI001CA90344|nr:uncharacterized protein LOC122504081 [Leptopilina heterotoma]